MRRDVSSALVYSIGKKAEERGRNAVEYIKSNFSSENVSFVDLKGINDVEVLYNDKDAKKSDRTVFAMKKWMPSC